MVVVVVVVRLNKCSCEFQSLQFANGSQYPESGWLVVAQRSSNKSLVELN